MTITTSCPTCGAPTRRAFATTDTYVTCIRNGHVHLALRDDEEVVD